MEEVLHVDVEALLRESQGLREDADRLLSEFRVLEHLRPYGDVEAAGSYRWNLMLRGDIDFYVVNPTVDLNLALDAFTQFVRRGDFLRFGFIDSARGKPAWADQPRSYPKGYYLGMARDYHNREWKVETWLLRSRPPYPDWLEERLTEEARRTILALKHLRRSAHLEVSSYDIYRAVLLGGARDPEAVRGWLARESVG